MSLRVKPHTVEVDLPDEIIQSNLLLGYGGDPQGSVRGQMAPGSSQTIYEKYGVETQRPWVFLCDAPEAPKFAEGGRLTWNGRTFAIVGGPELFTGMGVADNCQVSLSEVVE